MSAFTQNEIQSIYAPFPLEAHSIREGFKNKAGTRVRWFVYLDRFAIQRRLDELFPGEWEFSVDEIYRGDGYANITATLTIRGMSRSFNGGQSASYNTQKDPENLEKGAMTDTFRRVASVWGFGAYINEGVDLYTAGYAENDWDEHRSRENEAKNKFAAWYSQTYGHAPQDAPPRTSKRMPINPAPANGNGKLKSEPAQADGNQHPSLDTKGLTEVIAFMYPDDKDSFHRRGTIKNLLEDGTLSMDMAGYRAIEAILLHRAFKDFLLDEPMTFTVLTAAMDNGAPITSFDDWYKYDKTIQQAWDVLVAYNQYKDESPAKAKGNGGADEDVPF
jgi:hypothetical protein